MKVVLIGITPLSKATAQLLARQGCEVVFVDRRKDKIDALADEMDCGLVLGDGTRPAILREVGPGDTDVLYCLTDNDQSNILASLVARSLGFARVVTKIDDEEYEHICVELSMTDTIVPDRHIARALADLAQGREALDISTYFKFDLRLFSFVAGPDEAGPVSALKLPGTARAMIVYRDGAFILPDSDTEIRQADEVVLAAHTGDLDALRERWGAAKAADAEEDGGG
jgi:trk system potassium uptake protein TrkA